MISRLGNFRFAVDDINPNLCTHIVYSRLSLDIENNEIIKDLHFYNWHKKFTELKAKNHQLKVLIDLVPKPEKWNDTHIKLMVNSSHVEAIARNTVAFLQLNKFDGITIEFYPFEDEKIGFMNLVGEMRKAFLSFGYFLAVTGALYESRIEVGKLLFLQTMLLHLSKRINYSIFSKNVCFQAMTFPV